MTPPHLEALIPVGDGAALIKRRPDVRQAERRLAEATAQIGVATADLYPSIRLVGLYGGRGHRALAAQRQYRKDLGSRSLDQLEFPEHGRPARTRATGEGG